jgi:hypothetical protein
LLALVDRIRPAPADDSPNQWRLVTHLDNKVAVEAGRFTIAAPSGAMLRAVVAAPASARCEAEEATHRIEINYRYDHEGGQFTRRVVSFPGREFFFVVMTLGAGDAPAATVAGAGPDAVVKVGAQTVRFDGDKIVFGRFAERK